MPRSLTTVTCDVSFDVVAVTESLAQPVVNVAVPLNSPRCSSDAFYASMDTIEDESQAK